MKQNESILSDVLHETQAKVMPEVADILQGGFCHASRERPVEMLRFMSLIKLIRERTGLLPDSDNPIDLIRPLLEYTARMQGITEDDITKQMVEFDRQILEHAITRDDV